MDFGSLQSKLMEIKLTDTESVDSDNDNEESEETENNNVAERKNAEEWVNKISLEPFIQNGDVKLMTSLLKGFSTQSSFWIRSFIQLSGVDELLNDLAAVYDGSLSITDEVPLEVEILRCIKYLIDTKVGLGAIATAENGIKKLALGVLIPNREAQQVAVEILTVVCLMPRIGHSAVVEALSYLQEKELEKERFLSIVKQFNEATSVKSQVIYLTFLNTLVTSCTNLTTRHALRNELQTLGMVDIVQKLKEKEADNSAAGQDLLTQINVFEEESTMDYRVRNNSLA